MSPEPRTHHQPVTLHLSYWALALVAALLVLPWVLMLALNLGRPAPVPAPGPTAPAESRLAENNQSLAKPGPWGDLVVSRILIEPPESLIRAIPPGGRPTVWVFRDFTPADLAALWRSAPLTPAQRQFVAESGHAEVAANGIVYRPTDEFVESLTPEARAIIYTALSAFTDNPDQNDPYRFRADVADEWFSNSGLSDATIAQVKRLLYRRGSSLVFSDLNLVLPRIASQQERVLLVKTLARKSTLLVRLRLNTQSDLDALEAYWGRGLRNKDIGPLMQSLVRQGGNAFIDIIHLLPRVPRSLLYTYPSPTEPGSSTYLDCHWTVLNFFARVPDDRYQKLEAVTSAFLNDYYPVTGNPAFGDVIMFTKPNGNVIHSCVYIAADFVYTKNGASPNAPWILMSLSDVEAFYPSKEPLDIQYYRLKSYETSLKPQ